MIRGDMGGTEHTHINTEVRIRPGGAPHLYTSYP